MHFVQYPRREHSFTQNKMKSMPQVRTLDLRCSRVSVRWKVFLLPRLSLPLWKIKGQAGRVRRSLSFRVTAFEPCRPECSSQSGKQLCNLLIKLNRLVSSGPVIPFLGIYKNMCPYEKTLPECLQQPDACARKTRGNSDVPQ